MSEITEAAGVVQAGGAVLKLRVREVAAERPRIAEEQLAYAQVLDVGMKLGLLLLLVTFALYVTGLVSPHIPVTDLPRYWSLPVKEYLAATGIPRGWSWIGMLGSGDFLNFLGIAFLGGVAIACYLAISPIFFRKRDRLYGWLALVEVAVLALAASGLLKVGGH
ncbi:MAG TPA: hypothetical protein VIV57_06220 [Anaeromyxobacter sp.]